MSNIQIESDLKEVLGEINSKIGKIDSKIDKIDDRLKNIEVSQARLEEKFNSQEKIVTELKGSQDKQIWALIVLAFTAVVSLLIGLGKFIFFPNP
jgi:predicted nuclease with TOPRIM domain